MLFFFKIFFLMWPIVKVFIEFVTILPLFYDLFVFFFFFADGVCRILTPSPGIEPTHPALKGKMITSEPPGKSEGICS